MIYEMIKKCVSLLNKNERKLNKVVKIVQCDAIFDVF